MGGKEVSSKLFQQFRQVGNGRGGGDAGENSEQDMGPWRPLPHSHGEAGREEGVLFTWKERNILRKEDALSVRH